MPRLVGKPSNSGTYITLLLLATVGAVGLVEYMGVINTIPGFGSDYVGAPASSGFGASTKDWPTSQPVKGQPNNSAGDSPSSTQ